MIDFSKEKCVGSDIIRGVEGFWADYPTDTGDQERIPMPKCQYYGREIQGWAATAPLYGRNLLPVGPKATGESTLTENLAATSDRPLRDVSFYMNMDGAAPIGTDISGDNRVVFYPRPVNCCGMGGGFGTLDETSMARNKVLAVFHSILDFRRVIDVPGYDRIRLRKEARFIATMNYGYVGTKELNEALALRFVVIDILVILQGNLERLLRTQSPRLGDKYARQLALLFWEIGIKCQNGKISIKPLDLRGSLSTLELVEVGVGTYQVLDMGTTSKSFNPCEQTLIRDMTRSRIPEGLGGEKLFSEWI